MKKMFRAGYALSGYMWQTGMGKLTTNYEFLKKVMENNNKVIYSLLYICMFVDNKMILISTLVKSRSS